MTYYLPPNTYTNGSYTGSCYALGASGGFTVQQGFSEILLAPEHVLQKYDVTDAIQVHFSARTLNKKISILKDASNANTIQAWFDNMSETLHYDNLKICTCDFIDGIDTTSVLSVGKLSSLYSDFTKCVNTYFGAPGGFQSLFALTEAFNPNGGVFDASAYLQVINASTFNMAGSFVSDLSGYVTVSDINRRLDFMVDSNVFRNRDPTIHNWGIIDGFVAGDLIFVPQGFTISLSLDIQAESLLPINNVGPSYLNAIRDKLNWTNGFVTRNTTYTTTNITQTTTVPLLLVLTDNTLENYTNFGQKWYITLDTSLNWLSVSVSSTGKYQTAITETGDIYNSIDYGHTWNIINNIGNSPTNSISISFTGQCQTASNGHSIYVSTDYGVTWNQTYSAGTSNVFVSISLTGQYQTVVSCGDTVYLSNNYGATWTPINQNIDLYQSVEAFPTAGIALSYNGLYQTIVTEYIYISSDYGQTWTNVSFQNNFDDRNWDSVAMSSDGHYQTAIESGGDIYTSSNYGITWAFVNNDTVIDKQWESISLSATGQYQTALEQYGYVYLSNDYGVTWTISPDPLIANKNWQWVSVSSDGLHQTAVAMGGSVYVSSIFTTVNDASGSIQCVCD